MAKKRPVIAIALITAVCLAGDSMLYIVLPIHWKSVGLASLVEVGVLLSINRFVRLPLTPLISFMYTKISLRNGIILATLLGGITTLCYGLAEHFWVWLVLRSLWGMAWSLFKLGAFFLILELSSESNRGNMVGTYNGLYRVGSLIGMLLGGILVDLYGITYISVAMGILAFLIIPMIFKYIPMNISIQKQTTSGRKWLWTDTNIGWVFVTAFLSILLLEGMFNSILSHLIDLRLTSNMLLGAASIAGILQATRWLLLIFLSPRIGDLVDNTYKKEGILALFFMLAAIMFLVLTFKIPLLVWILFLFLQLLIASSLTTIVDTFVSEVAAGYDHKVKIMTAYTIVVDIGAAFGPIFGYILEARVGLSYLFWLSSIICLLISLNWLSQMSAKVHLRKKNNSNMPS